MPAGDVVGLLVGVEGGVCERVWIEVMLGEDVLLPVEAGEVVSEGVILGEDVLVCV